MLDASQTPESPSPSGNSYLMRQLLAYQLLIKALIFFSLKCLVIPSRSAICLIKSAIDLYEGFTWILSLHSFTYFSLLNGKKTDSLLSLIFMNIAFLNL